MNIILRVLFNSLGLFAIAEYVAGINISNFQTAIIAAFILGVLNTFVKPVLFILTLPVTIITLGLFSFILNAGIFFFAASFIENFEVQNFWYALLGSILMGVISAMSSKFID